VGEIQHVGAGLPRWRRSFERRSRLGVHGPSLRTLLSGRRRTIENLALAAVEAEGLVDTAPVLVNNAVAVGCGASRIFYRTFRRWGDVDLGLAGVRRVGAPFEPHESLVLVTDARAPNASVGRADPDRIASEFDAVILLWINRLIRLGPAGGDLAVAIGIDD